MDNVVTFCFLMVINLTNMFKRKDSFKHNAVAFNLRVCYSIKSFIKSHKNKQVAYVVLYNSL